MKNIYEQHFERTKAFAVLENGKHFANVTIRCPRDGAGRLYAYLHVIGAEMQRGVAGGYGYDKASAAIASAASKIDVKKSSEIDLFVETLKDAHGGSWDKALSHAGFEVINVC